jgi:hypothetical protein
MLVHVAPGGAAGCADSLAQVANNKPTIKTDKKFEKTLIILSVVNYGKLNYYQFNTITKPLN